MHLKIQSTDIIVCIKPAASYLQRARFKSYIETGKVIVDKALDWQDKVIGSVTLSGEGICRLTFKRFSNETPGEG